MNNNISESQTELIDLRSILKEIYRNKNLLLIVLFLSSVSSFLISLRIENIFESRAIVSFQDEELDIRSLEGGSFLSLAFQGLNSSSKSEDIFFETILSDLFIEKFLLERDLVWKILSLKKWDASTNKHFYDENLYDVQNKRWLKESREPHSKRAVRVFKKILDIDRNYASGVYAFSLKSISPEISYSWLNWYLEDINDFFRKQEIQDTSKSIKFLESKISQTNNIEIRKVFYNIIQEQTKELMLAEVNEEYFIKLIDKPQKAYIKSGPNRLTIVAATIVITLMMFVFLVAFLSIFNRKILFNFFPFQLKIQKN